MKFVHVNIIALDWKKLSTFYQKVFNCVPVPPERDLSGKWIEDITGIKNARIRGEHLRLPGGEDSPTLEIFSYDEMKESGKEINKVGFSHIAFQVDDVAKILDLVIQNGGQPVGEIAEQKYPNGRIGTFAYCRDIEGNIIELQKWDKNR